MLTERREFLGVAFDSVSKDGVLAFLADSAAETSYRFVVTPNVDHLVRLQDDQQAGGQLKRIYDQADLCLCDSKILHILGRLRGVDLPVVAGSELTALMFDHVIRPGDRVAIVGGDEEQLGALETKYPGVEFVQHRPPMGLRHNSAARRAAAEFVAHSAARFAFIAVGSPQQEMIAAEARSVPRARGTSLCIGASLDFLTGRQKRAPRLARRLGLEWAHRLLSDPRRMWRRYLLEGPRIFALAWRWGPPRHGAASK